MDYITLIGLSAAVLTTCAFIPQVMQIIKSGNVEGISISMYLVLNIGVALWLTYGIILKDLPIVLANGITLILTVSVLILTLYKRCKKSVS